MLDSGKMVGFVPTTDYEKARAFYEGKLGFEFISHDQFALVVKVGGHMIRISKMPNFVPLQVGQHEGQSVTLRGWLYNLRESGKLLFPIFRDGTGTMQGVAHVKAACRRRSLKSSRADAGVVGHCHRQGAGGQARAGRL
jgi:hypothetical protein